MIFILPNKGLHSQITLPSLLEGGVDVGEDLHLTKKKMGGKAYYVVKSSFHCCEMLELVVVHVIMTCKPCHPVQQMAVVEIFSS